MIGSESVWQQDEGCSESGEGFVFEREAIPLRTVGAVRTSVGLFHA